MANELQIAYGTTGRTLYAVVRTTVGTVWNGAAFVAFNAGNWTAYDIALTEQGTSGYYLGNFPSVAAGVYDVEVRDQSGGTPAITDPLAGSGNLYWTGTAVQSLSDVSLSAASLTLVASQSSVDDIPTNAEFASAIALLATFAQLVKVLAAVYDSCAASGNVLTLSDGATQTVNLTTGARTTA